ncbi:MAG: patatin-like phospholipase family protein [Blastocatellia bacterium]|nr:patatin-like phospholipase family protein [Blastocatellia bacterium]
MFKRVSSALCALLIVSFAAPAAFAQTAAPTRTRPTIGLVLSGGGARGFAHIGVLKVLEENRVPVDYVGGASIGGLIGALYAMGKTPAEIEELIGSLDWNRLFTSTTSFDNQSFRRKEDRRNIPGPIPLRGNPTALRLPPAFNTGHEIGLLFDKVTLPYAQVDNFDEMAIPFRTVATNMEDGTSVELRSGSLSRSLRATMSIPGVFAPIEIDGKILSDGGLVNNIPTNIVKAMGADILIVVNIETQLTDRTALENLFGVLAQTINIATLENSRRSLQQANLIIAPDLENYSAADFGNSEELIELGYQGASANVAILQGLSLGEADWQAHLERRRSRARLDVPPTPDFVAVDSTNRAAVRTIEEKLGGKYVGEPLDEAKRDELARDLSQLTGTGRFDALNFGLTSKNGRTGLVIRTNETNGRIAESTRLDIGFDINSVETENSDFSILARLSFFDVGRYGAEWRNDFRVGASTLLATEYYRPIGSRGFFISPRGSYDRRRVSFYELDARIAEYTFSTMQASIDAGYAYSPRSEVRLGYTIGFERADRAIGDPLLTDLRGRLSMVSLRWNYDGLDQAQVPRSGIYARNSLNYILDTAGTDSEFTQGETRVSGYHLLSERNTAFAFGGVGTSFGFTAPTLRQFTLGGPFKLGGYGVDQFRASNYAHVGIGVLHSRQFLPALFGGRAYVGGWYEGGSAFERFGSANYRQSASGAVIVETPLGPIVIGGGFSERLRGRFFFSFGRFLR